MGRWRGRGRGELTSNHAWLSGMGRIEVAGGAFPRFYRSAPTAAVVCSGDRLRDDLFFGAKLRGSSDLILKRKKVHWCSGLLAQPTYRLCRVQNSKPMYAKKKKKKKLNT